MGEQISASRPRSSLLATEDALDGSEDLLDGYPEVGKTYQGYDDTGPNHMGKNNYEACLRFTYPSTTKYYGGGAGTYASKDRVIYAFYALCWAVLDVTYDETIRTIHVKQVVRRYRNKAGALTE